MELSVEIFLLEGFNQFHGTNLALSSDVHPNTKFAKICSGHDYSRTREQSEGQPYPPDDLEV